MFTTVTTAYAILRGAIASRSQITCTYQGLIRHCCPHSIGYKDGIAHVLMFQFAGQSKSGLPPGGCWRCLDVADLIGVVARPGPWFTRNDHRQRQTCIDQVDLDITMS
jgi:hypothetical protein